MLRCVVILSLATILPAAAGAQSARDRTAADSLVQALVAMPDHAVRADASRLQLIESAFADDVTAHEKWAVAWYGLGLARLRLAETGALSRQGPLLPIGVDNATGAEHALGRAIQLDPRFAEAADALALAPATRISEVRKKERIAALRPVYRVLSGSASAAAAYVERDAGTVDSAVALEEQALRRGGVDSAVVVLSLVRDLYHVGRTQEGRDLLLHAASTTTPAGMAAYRAEVAWVASAAELSEWDAASPRDRPRWLANFWAKRDIAEGRRDGARLEEHYRRIDYALKNFRITLPRSGRQQLVSTTPSWADGYGAEERARQTIMHNPEAFPEAARLYAEAKAIGSESALRYYQPIQDLVSDKGIVWIRHGAPTLVAHNVTGPPLEIWRYDRPEGSLILYFREADFEGSSMPNELVPTVLDASPVVLNQLCHLDLVLCPTALGAARIAFSGNPGALESEIKAEGARLAPEALARSAARGKAFVDLATTTDSYHREFTHAVHPSVQMYGLARSAGPPQLVVTFALPGDALVPTTSSTTGNRPVYEVELRLMGARTADGRQVDFDTLRDFMTPRLLRNGEYITGVEALSVAAGDYDVSMTVTQADGRGAVAHLARVTVPGATPALAVSDLVLGSTASSVRWNSGSTDVALNPLNTFTRSSGAEVYYQLSGLHPGTNYQTKFEFFDAADSLGTKPRLTLASAAVTNVDHVEISRSLGLANLGPGRYRLKLTVSAGGASASSEAWLTIVK
jgi:hypothetical protein